MSVNIYFCPQNKMRTNFCSTKRSFERRHNFSLTLISYLRLIAPKARRLRLTISISMPWHLWTGIMICILSVCEIGISCQFTFTYFLLFKFSFTSTRVLISFRVFYILMAAEKLRHQSRLPTQFESVYWLLRVLTPQVYLNSLSVSVTVSLQHQLGLSSIFPSTPHYKPDTNCIILIAYLQLHALMLCSVYRFQNTPEKEFKTTNTMLNVMENLDFFWNPFKQIKLLTFEC